MVREVLFSVDKKTLEHVFGIATIFEIKEIRIVKTLPVGAGYHISSIYKLCEMARDYFDSHDNWWMFPTLLCDQYCDYFILKRNDPSNAFATFYNVYSNERHAVENFAKNSKGYIGPKKWIGP